MKFWRLIPILMVLCHSTKRGIAEPIPPPSLGPPTKRFKTKHICPDCTAEFTQLRNLYRHIRSQHTVTEEQVNRATMNGLNAILDYHEFADLTPGIQLAINQRLQQLLCENPNLTVSCCRTKHLDLLLRNDRTNTASSLVEVRRHKERSHILAELTCNDCDLHFTERRNLYRHKRLLHPEASTSLQQSRFKLKEDALRGYAKTYELLPTSKTDPMSFLTAAVNDIKLTLAKEMKELNGVKWFPILNVEMERARIEETQKQEVPFQGGIHRQLQGDTLTIDDSNLAILEKITQFTNLGSGWAVRRVINLELNIAKFNPISGQSYFDLPKSLKSQPLLNIKNFDNKCFLWSVIAHFHPAPQRADSRGSNNPNWLGWYAEFEKKFSTDDVSFPMKLSEIAKFEQANNMAVSVLGYDKGFYPLRISDSESERHVFLLLLVKGDKQHYVLVRDFDRLLRKPNHHLRFHCRWCMFGFAQPDILAEHIKYCRQRDAQRVSMSQHETIKFRNVHKQQQHPFVIYGDFECLTKKIETDDGVLTTQRFATYDSIAFLFCLSVIRGMLCLGMVMVQVYALQTHALILTLHSATWLTQPPLIHKHHTYRYQAHSPCAVAATLVGTDGTSQLFHYRGTDAADKLIEKLEEWARYVYDHTQNAIRMSPADWIRHRLTKTCHICNKPFAEGETKTADHDHAGGAFNYRGPAHKSCNLSFKLTQNIPVVFHNLTGYDAHIIVKAIARAGSADAVNLVARNLESYIGFKLKTAVGERNGKVVNRNLMFIDSLSFLNCSLAQLTDNLAKSGGVPQFHHLQQHHKSNEILRRGPIEKLLMKGVYPYDYACDADVFEEEILPPIEKFHNTLTDSDITETDYAHAQSVWREFDIINFGEYTDLYVMSDTLLLTDIFENFRKVVQQNYGLDPCHYFSTPGLSWDAMLKYTEVELASLSDPTMYAFFESGIRGGVASVMTRFARANRPDMTSFDSTAPTSYISYLDKNNLYGDSMSQPLPINGFQWITKLPANLTPEGKGYVLEVDLDYPNELHKDHQSFPLAPEHKTVNYSELSPYCQQLIDNDFGKQSAQNKLIPHLGPRQNYVIHSSNLALYTALGMEISKFHRGLQFNTSKWLAPYITLNTRLRQEAKSDFESSLYKLFNNGLLFWAHTTVV
jgi:hypothetical protein